MSDRSDLINQIACQIRTYRLGELDYRLDECHVERWVSQFDKDEQDVVLQETNALLSQCYFSHGKVKQFLFDIIECSELWGNGDLIDEIECTQFLNIQSKGTSQSHLLDLLDDMLVENYIVGLPTTPSTQTTHYIYLDDCLFSGNTLRRDLEKWIDSAKANTRLDIIFLATYSTGEHYIKNKILPSLCASKGIECRIGALKRYNNFGKDRFYYDCLWPKETADPNVSLFVEKLNQQAAVNNWPIRLFRDRNFNSILYTNNESREIFERALLKAGAYIYSCCSEPNSSMKPMGYDFFNSLGFGAFFATYKNISNNSPLAFWWGDPSIGEYHPFSKWYPLLPRKVNNNNDGFTWE